MRRDFKYNIWKEVRPRELDPTATATGARVDASHNSILAAIELTASTYTPTLLVLLLYHWCGNTLDLSRCEDPISCRFVASLARSSRAKSSPTVLARTHVSSCAACFLWFQHIKASCTIPFENELIFRCSLAFSQFRRHVESAYRDKCLVVMLIGL